MVDSLIKKLKENADPEQAGKMSAYMQNMFPFLGIPKPELKELIKPFLKESSKEILDWDKVMKLWNADFREAKYVAIEYLEKHKKQICSEDVEKLEYLIITDSWWETVDSIDAYVGLCVRADSSLKNKMLEWSASDNMWLRRVSIDYQQKFKEETDIEMLKSVIINNLGSKEFFINKAIGWSLREFSKTNPQWVIDFISEHKNEMAPLSIKEASKYIR